MILFLKIHTTDGNLTYLRHHYERLLCSTILFTNTYADH